MKEPVFEDVVVGQEIPTVVKGPMTTAHIMRWSAAMEIGRASCRERVYVLV